MDESSTRGKRCTAKAARGTRPCKKLAMLGGTVCLKHGGGAPQVRAKAAERLLADKLCIEFGLSRARDPERVIAEIGCLAFSRVGDMFDEAGSLLPIGKLPDHVQAALAGHETSTGNVDKGDGKMDRVVKIKVWDKPKMLEMLAKHHKLIGDGGLTVNIESELLKALDAGRKRAQAK